MDGRSLSLPKAEPSVAHLFVAHNRAWPQREVPYTDLISMHSLFHAAPRVFGKPCNGLG